MNYIRQEMLFSFEDMLDFNVKKRYETLLGNFNLSILHRVIGNQSHLGAPSQLNQYAMFISLIGRVVERIHTIKDLVRRLKQDPHFRWECGFIFSDRTPSEASYSRFIKLLADTNILDELNAKVIETAIVEGFMDGETISIDSTHIEARDSYQANQDQIIDTEPTLPPKKRGRKKKCEREAWVLKKQQEEENLPIYEKTIEKQLDIPLETLVSEMPMAPKWGVKKNSKGKNVFWYGYKGHLAVDSQSQYIVKGFLTSGNINDGKLAIPLMKSIFEKIPLLNVKHFLKDAGYDYEPIYRFALNHQTLPVIDYNKRNETQPEGFDKHFRPICKEGYSYVVDSYDAAYKTIKYTKPKECSNCPFSKEMECQKVHKIRVETDIRKYSPLARGSEKRKELYKKRSSVERVNAYLKEFFQLNNIRHKGGKLANIDFQFSILAYNLSKLGLDSLNRQLQEVAA